MRLISAFFWTSAKPLGEHNKLISKLKSIGVSNHVLNWVQNLLTERSQLELVDGYYSSPCPVTSGVLQGSVNGIYWVSQIKATPL